MRFSCGPWLTSRLTRTQVPCPPSCLPWLVLFLRSAPKDAICAPLCCLRAITNTSLLGLFRRGQDRGEQEPGRPLLGLPRCVPGEGGKARPPGPAALGTNTLPRLFLPDGSRRGFRHPPWPHSESRLLCFTDARASSTRELGAPYRLRKTTSEEKVVEDQALVCTNKFSAIHN